jgi:hypothetical protein
MLADGHPHVNSFPMELDIVREWEGLIASLSNDRKTLPGRLVDRHILSHYLNRPEISAFFESALKGFEDLGTDRPLTLKEYLISLNRRLFRNDNHFLFHSPGCQLETYFHESNETPDRPAKVLLLLRHPIQNYLAWVEHFLQKGQGYRPRNRNWSAPGLESVLHLALYRVLKAFRTAKLWQRDQRVLVSCLESFTARSEERQRIWKSLEIETHPALETTSRGGETEEAHSGKLHDTGVKPVTTDSYDPLLLKAEISVFERCASLFSPFYGDPMENVRAFSGDKKALLKIREKSCLRTNLEALKKRRERLSSILKKKPTNPREILNWSARTAYTLASDGLLYPYVHTFRNRKGVTSASRNLSQIPHLAGIDDSNFKN